MQIRKVQLTDVDSLHSLMLQYIVDFYQCDRPKDETLTHHIHHLMDHPEIGLQFVVVDDNQLIGFATLYFTFSTTRVAKIAILNDLFVSKQERGQHIGEQLFQTCLHYCREQGYATMNWETAQDNIIAQRLYKKMGGQRADAEWQFYTIEL